MVTQADVEIVAFVMSMVGMLIISIKIAKDYHREHHNQKRFDREQRMRNEMIINSQGSTGPRPPRAKRDDDRPTFSDGIRQVIAERRRLNALENGKQD